MIRRQRRGAWFGLLAMAWHIAVLLGQTVPAAAIGLGGNEAPPFLVNCVVYGSTTPAAAERNDNGQKPDRNTCPVCQLQACCHSPMPAMAPELPPITTGRGIALTPPPASWPARDLPLAAQPRAPPFTQHPA